MSMPHLADASALRAQIAASAPTGVTRRVYAPGSWVLLQAMRPKQWLKNGLVLLAFAFSVGEAWHVLEPASRPTPLSVPRSATT